MPLDDKVGRRKFLWVSAAGATSFFSGCGGDGPQDPVSPSDTIPTHTPRPVLAEISGDAEIQVPGLGQVGIGQYTSEGSTGPIQTRAWTATKDDDPFNERRVEDLGNMVNAQAEFFRPGTYTIKVEVRRGDSGEGSYSSKEMTTVVHPPQLPGTDYPLFAYTAYDDDSNLILNIAEPSAAARIPKILRVTGGGALFGQTLTWERSGERIATDYGVRGLGLMVYNLLTDEVVHITRGDTLWMPSWNPQKSWIAAVERDRALYSEPVLVRPDGSEALYLSGESGPDIEIAGEYPSWDPDGERLLLGGANFDITGSLQEHGYYDKRAAIYEGFFGGNVVRTQMPTEEQIRAFMDARGELNDENIESINVGWRGTSISPDGTEMLYSIDYGYGPVNYRSYIVKSRLDGTGDIQSLVSRFSVDILFSPKWSPDGRFIFFSGNKPGADSRQVFRISSEGKDLTVISRPSERGETIAWYQ